MWIPRDFHSSTCVNEGVVAHMRGPEDPLNVLPNGKGSFKYFYLSVNKILISDFQRHFNKYLIPNNFCEMDVKKK